MRSLVPAIALFTTAISSAIQQALIVLADDPLLIWNYGVMGALSFIGGCFFIVQFWGLDQEEDHLNMLVSYLELATVLNFANRYFSRRDMVWQARILSLMMMRRRESSARDQSLMRSRCKYRDYLAI